MEELIKVLWDMFEVEKGEMTHASVFGQKRIIHILPLVIDALNNEKRRKILVFLLKDKDAMFSFAKIREELSPIKKAQLSRHLQSLQKGWLVERRVDLSNPKIQKDPYFSSYQISPIGFKVLSWLADFLVIIDNDYLSKR